MVDTKVTPNRVNATATEIGPLPFETGSWYALIAARHLTLPSGELVVLAVLLSLHRPGGKGSLSISFPDLGRWTGFCAKTLGAHVASLRAKGLVDPDVLRPTPEAARREGEKYARIETRNVQRIGAAALRVLCHARMGGRKRIATWRRIAEAIGCSLRIVMRHAAALRAAGYSLARKALRRAVEKRFTSRRKKGSHCHSPTGLVQEIRVKKGVFGPDLGMRTDAVADFEAKRRAAKAKLVRLMREATA